MKSPETEPQQIELNQEEPNKKRAFPGSRKLLNTAALVGSLAMGYKAVSEIPPTTLQDDPNMISGVERINKMEDGTTYFVYKDFMGESELNSISFHRDEKSNIVSYDIQNERLYTMEELGKFMKIKPSLPAELENSYIRDASNFIQLYGASMYTHFIPKTKEADFIKNQLTEQKTNLINKYHFSPPFFTNGDLETSSEIK